MKDLYIALPGTVDLAKVESIVDSAGFDAELCASMKCSLKQYPDCIHWHFKQGKAAGILEVTWWSRQNEEEEPLLWLSVHGNRMADWVDPAMQKLKSLIEEKLHGSL